MSTALVETDDMMVLTCRVPCTNLDRLRHELELPPEADMARLSVELYKGILELRAPRVD